MRVVLLLLVGFLGSPFVAEPAFAEEEVVLASSKVLGTWHLVLDEAEQHQVDALTLAFRDPIPTDDEVAAMGDDVAMLVDLVVALRRVDPTDPALEEYRSGLIGLRDATLVVTEATMTLNIGAEVQELRYTVLDSRETRMRVETVDSAGTEARTILRLRDEDTTLSLVEESKGGARLTFTR